MNRAVIQDDKQLLEAVQEILARTRHGMVTPVMLYLLADVENKLTALIQSREHHKKTSEKKVERDKRDFSRLVVNVDGDMVLNGERYPVRIRDMGTVGFGMISPVDLAEGCFILLEFPLTGSEIESFPCCAVFSEPVEQGFMIGVKLCLHRKSPWSPPCMGCQNPR